MFFFSKLKQFIGSYHKLYKLPDEWEIYCRLHPVYTGQ